MSTGIKAAEIGIGDRVRIVKAYRIGGDLKDWERRLVGRCGKVTSVFIRGEYESIDVALDPLTPRQRAQHSVTLRLRCDYHPGSVDEVEQIEASS